MKLKEKNKKYCRDGRAPIPKDEKISRVMSANKGENTTPEITMRKALRELGLVGYRLHWKKVSGKPDIAYPSKKIAIFVNGCFWHRCPYCKNPYPKTNRPFWKKKFNNNIKRDKLKTRLLRKNGWKVFTFWECQIKKNAEKCAIKIKNQISK